MADRKEPDQMETWLGLLDDKERAEVLKVQIAEREKTERARIEQDGQTQRDDDVVNSGAIVRGLAVAAVVIVALCCTCVGHRAIDAWQEVKSPKFAPTQPVPATSASVAAPR